MKTRVDTQLRAEAARFALRFACEDCANFDAGTSRCVHEYPAAPRAGALDGGQGDVAFCKEFELGAGPPD